MSSVGDCFAIGSTVACTTCFNQEIVGEVQAFDQQTQMLILKCSKPDSPKLNDVYIVNICMIKSVQVTKESTSPVENPPSLNLQRISTRVRNQTEQKRRLVSALKAGVSREGQTLYMAITKMISEVIWDGPNIVVFNDVVITPPYTVDSVQGSPGSRQFTYVRKIVEKHTTSAMSLSADSSLMSLSMNGADCSGGVGGGGGGNSQDNGGLDDNSVSVGSNSSNSSINNSISTNNGAVSPSGGANVASIVAGSAAAGGNNKNSF